MKTIKAKDTRPGMILCDSLGAEVARVKATSERGDGVILQAEPLLPGAPNLFTLRRLSEIHIVTTQREIF